MEKFETIEDVYEAFKEVGCCSFATSDENGKVISRIAHFFASDDEGLYLRTMNTKPFYKQLVQQGVLSVCGEHTSAPVEWDEDNMPHFQPGYAVRANGEVRELLRAEVEAKAAENPLFNVAVHDIKKYPTTRIFVLDRFWAECFDYDFNMVNRDHKLLRTRVAFGGAECEPAGLRIDSDICIGCGICYNACTYKAIEPGDVYRIRGERCDECGSCFTVCPVEAIIGKGL